MELGVYLLGIGRTYEEFKSEWLEAERLGYDAGWMMDNVVGPLPLGPEESVFDAWTVLPSLAEASSTIRLGTLVTPAGRRHPSMLAKSSSILDVISNGRLEVGLGPGDEPRHFVPWGMAFPPVKQRILLLRDTIEVMTRMWTRDRANYSGTYVQLEEAINYPKPVQDPHPPIWIGLIFGRKVMPRLAAEYADGINLYIQSDSAAREMLETVEKHCQEIGRDFSTIRTSRSVNVAVTDDEVDIDALYLREAERLDSTYETISNHFNIYNPLIYGPADYCIEELKRRGAGFDQLIIQFSSISTDGVGIFNPSYEGELEAMRRFSSDVMDDLRSFDSRNAPWQTVG